MRSTTPGGVLMRSWLTGAGLDLEHDVMVTSVLKCSDASKFQRRPVPAHVAACSRFRQVEDAAYPPRLIVAVGKYAYQATTGLPYSERSSEVVQVNGQSVFAVESPTWASISATNRNEFFARASYLRRFLIGAGLIQGV